MAIGGLYSSVLTEVQNSTSVLLLNFCAKNLAFGQPLTASARRLIPPSRCTTLRRDSTLKKFLYLINFKMMNTSITIDILNPKAVKLLKNLAELNLISIKEESKKDFADVLKNFRSNSKSAPSLEEITNEVEKVRAKRYER